MRILEFVVVTWFHGGYVRTSWRDEIFEGEVFAVYTRTSSKVGS